MATQYTLAIALTKDGGEECIYCGKSEDDAIKAAQESDFDEIHIVSRPGVGRVIDNSGRASRKPSKKSKKT